jgi:hypothetical protein
MVGYHKSSPGIPLAPRVLVDRFLKALAHVAEISKLTT